MGYLRERELVTNVYKERIVPVSLAAGHKVSAVTYVADPLHEQYAGGLSAEDAARIVRLSVGRSGPNTDYVVNTIQHLADIGIRDPWLENVASGLEQSGG
jgi:cation transport protein ChaC